MNSKEYNSEREDQLRTRGARESGHARRPACLPCGAAPGAAGEEVDVHVRAAPSHPQRDVSVIVTLSGPRGRPVCRVGAQGWSGQPCNENRRVFD